MPTVKPINHTSAWQLHEYTPKRNLIINYDVMWYTRNFSSIPHKHKSTDGCEQWHGAAACGRSRRFGDASSSVFRRRGTWHRRRWRRAGWKFSSFILRLHSIPRFRHAFYHYHHHINNDLDSQFAWRKPWEWIGVTEEWVKQRGDGRHIALDSLLRHWTHPNLDWVDVETG